jgi:4-alpha-glucanotransferase
MNGRWVPGPGAEFFQAVQNALGPLPVIAEDLGMITPEVHALREQFGFPGMRVLQFSFGSGPSAYESRPYSYPLNCVVYTGTHDNNTTIGWFKGEDVKDSTQSKEEREQEKQVALAYLGTDGHEINWDFIRLALMSLSNTTIIPMQDILGLDSEARMNIPGKAEGNWRWRFTPDMLTEEIKAKLKKLTLMSGRYP